MKPTDERLKERIAKLNECKKSGMVDYGDFIISDTNEEIETLTDLLASRQTIRRLVEDGERLANNVRSVKSQVDDKGNYAFSRKDKYPIGLGEALGFGQLLENLDNAIKAHTALMKELNAEDTTHRVLWENMEAWEELGKDKEEK